MTAYMLFKKNKLNTNHNKNRKIALQHKEINTD